MKLKFIFVNIIWLTLFVTCSLLYRILLSRLSRLWLIGPGILWKLHERKPYFSEKRKKGQPSLHEGGIHSPSLVSFAGNRDLWLIVDNKKVSGLRWNFFYFILYIVRLCVDFIRSFISKSQNNRNFIIYDNKLSTIGCGDTKAFNTLHSQELSNLCQH